ncbi:hypothetical protein B0T14DRAFT_289392 [Immersiella caudata]|uniref:Uncharacterized protein n=1 Tax=Immersiella caudata TaxID=314043 RepID=A0AA40BUB0_9PEZI|nr:hypothetical protein B0T14DRAFT_289392 [Immersiella caudata]
MSRKKVSSRSLPLTGWSVKKSCTISCISHGNTLLSFASETMSFLSYSTVLLAESSSGYASRICLRTAPWPPPTSTTSLVFLGGIPQQAKIEVTSHQDSNIDAGHALLKNLQLFLVLCHDTPRRCSILSGEELVRVVKRILKFRLHHAAFIISDHRNALPSPLQNKQHRCQQSNQNRDNWDTNANPDLSPVCSAVRPPSFAGGELSGAGVPGLTAPGRRRCGARTTPNQRRSADGAR